MDQLTATSDCRENMNWISEEKKLLKNPTAKLSTAVVQKSSAYHHADVKNKEKKEKITGGGVWT